MAPIRPLALAFAAAFLALAFAGCLAPSPDAPGGEAAHASLARVEGLDLRLASDASHGARPTPALRSLAVSAVVNLSSFAGPAVSNQAHECLRLKGNATILGGNATVTWSDGPSTLTLRYVANGTRANATGASGFVLAIPAGASVEDATRSRDASFSLRLPSAGLALPEQSSVTLAFEVSYYGTDLALSKSGRCGVVWIG